MTVANDNQSFEALTFDLQGEVFALGAHSVREILDVTPVTLVPGARDFVPGLINVRGRVVPLADLRVWFGMPHAEASADTRIIVVEIDLDGEPTIVGLLADKVYEVTQIAGASIEDTPPIGMTWPPEYVRGIGKRGDDFIIIPNIERIFCTA
ncbi:MAG TPA: chemotaxis protein CheW [Azospirillum sp.]|nr:chemotaxis protein CheW [Azospirillum sp.]